MKPNDSIKWPCIKDLVFFKALNSASEAKEMLDMILDLYLVEYLAAERGIVGSPEHLLLRQTESRDLTLGYATARTLFH